MRRIIGVRLKLLPLVYDELSIESGPIGFRIGVCELRTCVINDTIDGAAYPSRILH